VTVHERRAEIIRILVSRRHETMGQLANELGVTDRTIRSDITALTVDYPLKTIRGNGGCVRIADNYYPHKNIFSQEQQAVLIRLMVKADEYEYTVLCDMLAAFGSSAIRKLVTENY